VPAGDAPGWVPPAPGRAVAAGPRGAVAGDEQAASRAPTTRSGATTEFTVGMRSGERSAAPSPLPRLAGYAVACARLRS
jgi:hypothetical protein